MNEHQDDPRPWARALRGLCLRALQKLGGSATTNQICAATGKPASLIAPRMTELEQLSRVRRRETIQTGQRGRPQIVWEAAPDQAPAHLDASQETSDAPAWLMRYGN